MPNKPLINNDSQALGYIIGVSLLMLGFIVVVAALGLL
jgi:hypothetical protein